MIPGCTTALPIDIDDQTLDLSQAAEVWVTLSQAGSGVTVTGERVTVSGQRVTAYFSQQDSLRLRDNEPATGQINWIYNDSGIITRGSTDPFPVNIGTQLLRRALP